MCIESLKIKIIHSLFRTDGVIKSITRIWFWNQMRCHPSATAAWVAISRSLPSSAHACPPCHTWQIFSPPEHATDQTTTRGSRWAHVHDGHGGGRGAAVPEVEVSAPGLRTGAAPCLDACTPRALERHPISPLARTRTWKWGSLIHPLPHFTLAYAPTLTKLLTSSMLALTGRCTFCVICPIRYGHVWHPLPAVTDPA